MTMNDNIGFRIMVWNKVFESHEEFIYFLQGHVKGVTRQTIYNWLKGTHRIHGDKLIVLADLLSCQPRDLIGFAEVVHEVCV